MVAPPFQAYPWPTSDRDSVSSTLSYCEDLNLIQTPSTPVLDINEDIFKRINTGGQKKLKKNCNSTCYFDSFSFQMVH